MSEPYRAPCELCKGTRVIRRMFSLTPLACPWCCGTDPTTPAAQELRVLSDEQQARAA